MKAGEAVVLVGHGAPAKDCPADLVRRWKTLEANRRATGGEPSEEEKLLDARIRNWPRAPETDPYQAGIEALARHLKPLLNGDRLTVAYNEFCKPSLDEAVGELVTSGFEHITVIPTMLTPGGVHSEEEIPEELEKLRKRFPHIELQYAWPFEMSALARLLGDQLQRFR